jgi:osmotically-inducible protein OsmY
MLSVGLGLGMIWAYEELNRIRTRTATMPSRHEVFRSLLQTALVFALIASASAVALAQSGTAQRDAVARALAGERDFRNIEVSLDADGRVLLTGDLPLLWVKLRAIESALEAAGGLEIVSELTVPEAESDEALAEAVAKVIQRYAHYTVFDYISGSINDGVVMLSGKVTAVPDKAADLTERVARVRGVRDIQNRIETLTPSRSDDRLRASLARSIFRHPSFEGFRNSPNPPFHVVVDRGVVTLIGYVQSEIELREIEQIVAFTQGTLRIDNQLETLR